MRSQSSPAVHPPFSASLLVSTFTGHLRRISWKSPACRTLGIPRKPVEIGQSLSVTSVPGFTRFLRGRVVGPDLIHDDAIVTITDGLIQSVATPHEWRAENPGVPLPRLLGTLLPGLVDIHCHGAGDASFATTDVYEAARAASYFHSQGTTSVVASLTPAPVRLLLHQIATLYPLALSGDIAGIHLELPGLDHLPTARRLVEQGEGTVCLVTLDDATPHYSEIAHLLDSSRVSIETQVVEHSETPSLLDTIRSNVADATMGLIEAVRIASLIPAQEAGIDHHVGAIAPGLRADLLIVDENLTLQRVMRDGVWLDEQFYIPIYAAV
jgi:hypothetical protein